MKIELKGIVQYHDGGHRCVDVIVRTEDSDSLAKSRVGVDIEVGRGKILGFLAALYGVKPVEIVWPRHIKA